MPDLAGKYFYADYCAATIFSFVISGGVVTNEVDRTAELLSLFRAAARFVWQDFKNSQRILRAIDSLIALVVVTPRLHFESHIDPFQIHSLILDFLYAVVSLK